MTTSKENMQRQRSRAKQVVEKGIENNERLSGAKNKPTRNDEKKKQTNRASVELTNK